MSEPRNSPMKMVMSQTDIDSLDTDALRENMVKGIYMLESALFNQAGYECSRVGKTRRHIEIMESDLFKPESLEGMDVDQKINLYRLATQTMQGSMKFLQDLHGNIATGIEAMNSIETLKSRAKVKRMADSKEDDNTASGISEVKQLIMDEIRARVEART